MEPPKPVSLSLARVLTYIKRVKEQIGLVENDIRLNNSVVVNDGEPAREVDVRRLLVRRSELVDHLIDLKVALTKANTPIQPLLLALAEAKGKLAFYRTLNTRHGTTTPMYREDLTVTYDATVRKTEADAEVLELTKFIDRTQAGIDSFNHTTTIQVDDLGLF